MRKAEVWGSPHEGPPDVVVTGSDSDLAAAVAVTPGVVVRFVPGPSSDLARALGLVAGGPTATAAPLDALRLGDGDLAVNMVVSGTTPGRVRAWHRRRPCVVEVDDRSVFEGRATTVVVANGQFLDGDDVVPRGHPGDGRLEVQVYAVAPGQRRSVRRRLPTGTHLPHPEIRTFQGQAARITWRAPMPLHVDPSQRAATPDVEVMLMPSAFAILL